MSFGPIQCLGYMSMEDEIKSFHESFEKHTLDDSLNFSKLRDSLVSIESEVAEIKRIGIETHEQTLKTNGSVASLKRFREQSVGGAKVAIPFLALLVAAMGWFAVDYLNHRDQISSEQTQQIQAAVDTAFKQNLPK